MTPENEIASRPFKVGERTFEGGDKFSPDLAPTLGELHITRLRQQKYVLPLTAENYAVAIARRPQGTVGRGFTAAYLQQAGIIMAPPEPAPRKATRTPKKADKPKPEISYGTLIPFAGNFIRPKKVSRFVYYDVVDAEGRLLRDKMLRSIPAAEAFLTSLSAESQNSGTTGAKENTDGLQLQPDARQPD